VASLPLQTPLSAEVAEWTRRRKSPINYDVYKNCGPSKSDWTIESKSKGKPAEPEKVQRLAPVIDLMSALKKSLAEGKRSETASKAKKFKKSA
jgi:non-homologous end joining protein Ku